MKTYKQLVESLYYEDSVDVEPINLDEHLSLFAKTIDEQGTVGYTNDRLRVPLKHERLHEWVMAAGYRYESKTFRPQTVTEHVYVKDGGSRGDHHLLVLTKGDQRDVWQVFHDTVN